MHPAEGAPYNVALIDCDEGFRLMSRVEDIAPEQVRIGQRVRFRVHRPGGEEPPYPVFAAGGGRVMEGLKRGSAAIVGVAESDLGQVADGMSVIDLMAQGVAARARRLRAEAEGRRRRCSAPRRRAGCRCWRLPSISGIDPPFLGSTIVGGSSFEYHVAHAMGAIAHGLCNVAVIAYGSTQRSVGRKQASVREINPYETPFKPFLPSSAYALAASRHMHQFGTTREQLAAVAVAAREWALLNPAAWEKKPLTIEGVLSVAHGELSLHGARLLPRHRRRRRDRRHLGRARQVAQEASRPTCWAAASRSPTPTSPACPT